MSELNVTIGDVTLPWLQAQRIYDAIQDLRARGVEPVWHLNNCGCCASVHPPGKGGGWVIDKAGGAEWLEGPP